MKKTAALIIGILLSLSSAYAKPMTESVRSWEGEFRPDKRKVPIRIQDKPTIFLWRYELNTGSKGTCIGFSTEDGDMILAPRPNEKGVQPLYSNYTVLFNKTGGAEIIIFYSVQGNGGQRFAEKYLYDGKGIRLTAQSLYGGKTNPVWKDAAEKGDAGQ